MKSDNNGTFGRARNLSVGIAGVGYVGTALKRYFEGAIGAASVLADGAAALPGSPSTHAREIIPQRTGENPGHAPKRAVYAYDKYKQIGSVAELNKADVIFLCVPTPYDDKHGFDMSALEEVFGAIKGSKTVVIKSTVVPGTTEHFQKKYPRLKVLFNPEFLTQLTADADILYPDRQLVGYTSQSYGVAKDLLQMLPLAPFERILPAGEAEMVKYFSNTWFATKVVFANQIYDLCEELGLDYETVKECAAQDKRIGRSHLDIWHGGYRGFAGACLPKDMKSFIRFAAARNVDLKLLKTVVSINEKLRKIKPKESK
ncbi:MAG: hypothetical protein Q8R13_04900 [bacterium]|nr:hypothetical protein [bacterium]MDZ4296659.1 hypothetical protein [Patescibacteria group bacterium]